MDPEDWKYDHVNRNHTIEYVDSKLGVNDLQTNGPIILQHDTLESTCEIQSLLIKILKKRNFNIVTIDECIGFHNITNQPIH